MKIAALIDGDILAYRHASAAEKPVEWAPDQWTLQADAGAAKIALEDEIAAIKEALGATSVVVALTDSTNFRKELYPLYKGNRTGRKPMILSVLRKHIEETYDTYVRPTLEADDVLGILATHSSIVRADKRVIVSSDKDFKGVPCFLWNPTTPLASPLRITEQDANRWHLIQTLTGDTTDNYPGCPGIGAVRAGRLVSEALNSRDPWALIVEAFEKAGLTAADALLQARLARILRASDYDFKEKRPILWTPDLLKTKAA